MSRRSPARVKDVLLEHVSRDIKQLHSQQSDMSTVVDMVTASNRHAQALCEHLDHILMHGLREYDRGYWPFVSYFTRSEAIGSISHLSQVTSDIGRGRAWLYLSLNEQVMESYVRMFVENQDVTQEYYMRESFLRDIERLLILQTLMSGLDFIPFDLPVDCSYLDYGASEPSSRLGVAHSAKTTPGIFRSDATQESGSQVPRHEDLSTSYSESSRLHRRSSLEQERPRTQSSSVVERQPSSGERERSVGGREEKGREEESQQTVDSSLEQSEELQNGGIGVEDGATLRAKPMLPQPIDIPRSKRDSGVYSEASPQPSSLPQTAILKRMSHSGSKDHLTQSLEEPKHGNGTVEDESEDLVVRMAPGSSRQRKSKPKKRKKKRKDNDSEKNPSLRERKSPEATAGVEAVSREEREVTAGSTAGETLSVMKHESGDRAAMESKRKDTHTATDSGSVKQSGSVETEEGADQERLWENSEGAVVEEGARLSGLGGSETSASLPARVGKEEAVFPGEQRPEDSLSREEKSRPHGQKKPQRSLLSPLKEASFYKGAPQRPKEITEADKCAADVRIDANTPLVFQLDIFFKAEEQIERLVQVRTPTRVGHYKVAYILISTEAVYLLRKDGIEGLFSREIGIRFSEFHHIVIGLGWQSLIFVYQSSETQEEMKCVVLTGSEAISRSIVDSIHSVAIRCPGFKQAIPWNRDDDTRIEAIERELIKLGSHTSMDIVQYSLVNWEELGAKDGSPQHQNSTNAGAQKSGNLMFKSTNVLGLSSWKPAFFQLRNGYLYQYSSETDTVAKSVYTLGRCGGCTRASGEGKPYALSVLGGDGSSLVLATSTEDELAQWVQALCEAVIEESPHSPTSRRNSCLSCSILLTQNKIHVLKEDWSNESVQLVTSCEVTDVNGVGVDCSLPSYCTISYDQGDSQGLWLVCFNSEYELGKFESALAAVWKEQFQIDLQFSEVGEREVWERAHRAVELIRGSRYRTDSITKGRTEFTYSTVF